MDWLKCNICFNTYNEASLRPRSLSCGHTYCERCLNNMIQNQTLTCPQCRKIHEIHSIINIPINFTLEGLLKSLNTCSQDLTEEAVSNTFEEKSDTDEKRETHGSFKSLLKQQEISLSAQKELLKISAGMCNEHPHKECQFRCSIHMCWVCEHCIEVHGDHPKNNCKILSFREELEERRQEQKQSLTDERKSCNVFLSIIEKHIYYLNDKEESHTSLINNIQGFLNVLKNEEENLQMQIIYFKSIIEKGENVRQKLLDVEGTVLNAATLDESNAARELVISKKTEARKFIDISQKEVDEDKRKIESMDYSTEYRENCLSLHQELDKIIKRTKNFEKTANKIGSMNIEFAKMEAVPGFFDKTPCMNNEQDKNETKKVYSEIVEVLKCFVSIHPNEKKVELFRLKIIFRLLQISFLSCHTNQFDVENDAITNVSYDKNCHNQLGQEKQLTVKGMLEWIKEDLGDIWTTQHHDPHESVVRNLNSIISNLASDSSTEEQFNLVYNCFQTLWISSSEKQRMEISELVQQLLKYDKFKDNVNKCLTLLWSLAHSHSENVYIKQKNQALYHHVKILDYTCLHLEKKSWLHCCVEELKKGKGDLTALKHIREICCTYSVKSEDSSNVVTRTNIISILHNQYYIVTRLQESLIAYMEDVSCSVKKNPNLNPEDFFPDGYYNHTDQVQERLSFIQFLLHGGELWMCIPPAKQIWSCLIENSPFVVDRDTGFKWFTELCRENDLDPEYINDFFENKVLQLDPSLLTNKGMECFESFFTAVNQKNDKLVHYNNTYLMEDKDLAGLDYLWRIILYSSEEISSQASELLRKTFTNLGPSLYINQVSIHDNFISASMSHLAAIYDNVLVVDCMFSVNTVYEETTRVCRVLTVLYKYMLECDREIVKTGYDINHDFQDMLNKYSALKLYSVKL